MIAMLNFMLLNVGRGLKVELALFHLSSTCINKFTMPLAAAIMKLCLESILTSDPPRKCTTVQKQINAQ
jgi:hypothetical protein